MTTRVQFWREINANGHSAHSVVRTFMVPAAISDQEAVEIAKCRFCDEMGLRSWHDGAHGYDVASRCDDRRDASRWNDGIAYWTEKTDIMKLVFHR